MELVTPGIGLVFWMLLTFSILLWILAKFAWKPILKTLKDREQSIDEALGQAEKARKEMANLQADNEKLLKEARNERDAILKEAKEIKDGIIGEAKGKAEEEGKKMIANAKAAIESEKQAAVADMKLQLASLSIAIAEKILKEQLSSDTKQQELVKKYVDEVNFN